MSNYASRKARNPHDVLCLVQPCHRKVLAKGMCDHHYNKEYYRRSHSSVKVQHDGLVKTGVPGWGSM